MRHIFIPTQDFGLADPVNAQLVLRLMDRLDEDTSFCPVITVTSDGTPVAPREAKHLLTAAHWLGWKQYPAQEIWSKTEGPTKSVQVGMAVGSR